MKLTPTTTETELELYLEGLFYDEYHIGLKKVFSHANGKSAEWRKKIIEKSFKILDHVASWKFSDQVVYLFQYDCFTIEERKIWFQYYFIDAFKQHMKQKLNKNIYGWLFHKGLLNVDEMEQIIEFCTQNKINVSRINLRAFVRKIVQGEKDLSEFQKLRYVLNKYSSFDEVDRQLFEIKNVISYSTKDVVFKNEYKELIEQLHKEGIVYGLIKKNIVKKIRYLYYFAESMTDEEQSKIMDNLMEKRLSSIACHAASNWRYINGLKGEAQAKYDALKVFHKLS